MSTSFKNQNIGLISGWGHGETNWGTPLNDNLMILDTLCQSVVKKIISSSSIVPVINNAIQKFTTVSLFKKPGISLKGTSLRFINGTIFIWKSCNEFLISSFSSKNLLFTSFA